MLTSIQSPVTSTAQLSSAGSCSHLYVSACSHSAIQRLWSSLLFTGSASRRETVSFYAVAKGRKVTEFSFDWSQLSVGSHQRLHSAACWRERSIPVNNIKMVGSNQVLCFTIASSQILFPCPRVRLSVFSLDQSHKRDKGTSLNDNETWLIKVHIWPVWKPSHGSHELYVELFCSLSTSFISHPVTVFIPHQPTITHLHHQSFLPVGGHAWKGGNVPWCGPASQDLGHTHAHRHQDSCKWTLIPKKLGRMGLGDGGDGRYADETL